MNLFNSNKILRYHRIWLFIVFMAVISMRGEAVALDVYKWIDQYGVTHYSTEAPQDHEKAAATVLRLEQQPWGEVGPTNRTRNYLPLLELAKELEQSRLVRERLRREKVRLERERLSAEKAASLDRAKIPQQDRVYISHPPPYYGYYRFPFPRHYSHHGKSYYGKRPGFKSHKRHLRYPKSITAYKGYRGLEPSLK